MRLTSADALASRQALNRNASAAIALVGCSATLASRSRRVRASGERIPDARPHWRAHIGQDVPLIKRTDVDVLDDRAKRGRAGPRSTPCCLGERARFLKRAR